MKDIKFDKIKISTDAKNIKNIDKSNFETKMLGSEVVSYTFSQNSPSELFINVDCRKNELTIEFTGKILLDDYHFLISNNTIRKCFENINSLNVCELDIDNILVNSKVLKCDVTKDVSCDNVGELTARIVCSITNHKKYSCKQTGQNLEIYKTVATSNRKLRLVIYDKGKEMKRQENSAFLLALRKPSDILEYYQGKCRFELNLNSMKQVREMLNIADNELFTVLQSNERPIAKFMDKILCVSPGASKMTLNKFMRLIMLRYYNFDMIRVEAAVRQHLSPKTHFSQVMKPFIALCEQHRFGENDMKEEILKMLS